MIVDFFGKSGWHFLSLWVVLIACLLLTVVVEVPGKHMFFAAEGLLLGIILCVISDSRKLADSRFNHCVHEDALEIVRFKKQLDSSGGS